jgi:hypothetical protein
MRMRFKFPAFVVHQRKDGVTWRGPLQPQDGGTIYIVSIRWQEGGTPEVWVDSPTLATGTPHLYPQGRLCLYYPDDRTWHRGRLIADTIVPLTAEWLLFYEFWLLTGMWYGPEAPHASDQPKTLSL